MALLVPAEVGFMCLGGEYHTISLIFKTLGQARTGFLRRGLILSFCGVGENFSPSYSIPRAVYAQDWVQSNTFGLHIGAAKLGYTGSLVFGGYDRARVIGPVMSFPPSGLLQVLTS